MPSARTPPDRSPLAEARPAVRFCLGGVASCVPVMLISLVLTACVSARTQVASGPPRIAPNDAARSSTLQTAARWLETVQGLDALEAYELKSSQGSLSLAVARKRLDDEVRVLSYVIRPLHLNEVALLALQRPGLPVEIFTYATPQLYGRGPGGPPSGVVIRASSMARALFLASAAADAVELLLPVLPEDYRFETAGESVVEGEPCAVLRALPTRSRDDVTEIKLWISERTGVALRREYVSDGENLWSVEVSPESVRSIDGRWTATVQRVRTPDGDEAELALVNTLPGVELPERLFTRRSLRRQRFPSF